MDDYYAKLQARFYAPRRSEETPPNYVTIMAQELRQKEEAVTKTKDILNMLRLSSDLVDKVSVGRFLGPPTIQHHDYRPTVARVKRNPGSLNR